MWTEITQIYSILLIYLLAACPTPNPTHFPFLSFSFFFFLPFFLSHKSQPYTFCNTPAKFKSKERQKEGGATRVTPPTPLPPTTHLTSIITLLAGHSFAFFFFFSYNKHFPLSLSHPLPQYPLHSTTSTIIFLQGSPENSIGKR